MSPDRGEERLQEHFEIVVQDPAFKKRQPVAVAETMVDCRHVGDGSRGNTTRAAESLKASLWNLLALLFASSTRSGKSRAARRQRAERV